MIKVFYINNRVNQSDKHPDVPPIVFSLLVVYYAVKFSMPVQCFPSKEDYWKGYIMCYITYPDLVKWMIQEEYEYIDYLPWLSKYSIARSCD